MRTIVITYPVPQKALKEILKEDYVIVVDKALSDVVKKNIHIHLVVGDMDSSEIMSSYETIILPKEKDVTDTHAALEIAIKRGQPIELLGGIGGRRIEHFLANLLLLQKFKKVVMKNDDSIIRLLETGTHQIETASYVSFFATKESMITLKGFKYPLNQYVLSPNDPLCISNELQALKGTIIIQGEVLMMITERD